MSKIYLGILILSLMPLVASSSEADFSISFGGLKRTYLVHFPKSGDKAKPLPVVLAFHGGGGTAEAFRKSSRIDESSDKNGFIAVYPQGTGKERRGKLYGTWNAGLCCGEALKQKVDDVGFVSLLIDDLTKHYSIDPKRVYATGHSNGAQISYRLACELSDRIAAVAPVSAQGFEPCKPKRAVPIFHIHGLEDRCCPYRGGQCGGCFQEFINHVFKANLPLEYSPCPSVPDYISEWKTRNHCKGKGKITESGGDLSCLTYDQCSNGADVTVCTLKNTGHSWPGGAPNDACGRNPSGPICQEWEKIVGKINSSVSANDLEWAFFQKHKLP